MMNSKIPFGLQDGTLVTVDGVDKGLACHCCCPHCHQPLVARKGEKRRHHFAHQPEVIPCEQGYETAIHLMAKQILAECRILVLPELVLTETDQDAEGQPYKETQAVCDKRHVRFDQITVEPSLEGIKPDIVAYSGNKRIVIEITVTHFMNADKKRYLHEKNIPCIEIDLSKEGRLFNKADLERAIIEKTVNKSWIFHPGAARVRQALKDKLATRIKEANERYQIRTRHVQPQPPQVYRPIGAFKNPQAHVKLPGVRKQYPSRWFVCEACRAVFELPAAAANLDQAYIPCPDCKGQVSTFAPPR